MRTRSPFKAYQELQVLATTLERQYGAALHDGNRQDMIESCGGLCIVYSAMGNSGLGQKWAEQYLVHLAECTGGGFLGRASEEEGD